MENSEEGAGLIGSTLAYMPQKETHRPLRSGCREIEGHQSVNLFYAARLGREAFVPDRDAAFGS